MDKLLKLGPVGPCEVEPEWVEVSAGPTDEQGECDRIVIADKVLG